MIKNDYSYAQLMYNQYGKDECYATLDCAGMNCKQIVTKLCKQVDFCEGMSFKEFYKEFENEQGVVYTEDGVGIYIVKDKNMFEEFYNAWEVFA